MFVCLSHLSKHKFKHSFRDTLNPICSCGFKSTSHYFLHYRMHGPYWTLQKSILYKAQQAGKWLFSLPSCFCSLFAKLSKYSIGGQPLINYFFSANTDSDHNDSDITVEVDDYVAAVYDCKAYVGKVLGVDELDLHISFFAHKDLSISSTFVIPKVPDEVWVAKENILCIVPRPNEDKRGKRARLVLDETVLKTILQMLEAWV